MVNKIVWAQLVATLLVFCSSTWLVTVRADPAFECVKNETGKSGFVDYAGYETCEDCSCQVFEHMCLIKDSQRDRNFTLQHRSLAFGKTCKPPECICNQDDNWVKASKLLLREEKQLGERTLIPVPQFADLNQTAEGTYEWTLNEEFKLPSDDERSFGTPFLEETIGQDLLRRVSESQGGWSAFIDGCQDGEESVELTCDLHYEKTWSYRRRFTRECSLVTVDTDPCSGTYACLCSFGEDKTYFKVSKTLPVIPKTYTGLKTTTLSESYAEETTDNQFSIKESDNTIGGVDIDLIIIIGSSIGGAILLCCCCYCACVCCANRSHQVTYMEQQDKKEKGTMSKRRMSTKSSVQKPIVQQDRTASQELVNSSKKEEDVEMASNAAQVSERNQAQIKTNDSQKSDSSNFKQVAPEGFEQNQEKVIEMNQYPVEEAKVSDRSSGVDRDDERRENNDFQ